MSHRSAALDGVRGLCALGVLIHHVVLVWLPSTRRAYESPPADISGPLDWLLTYTPLHITWIGTTNVLVFFALSGFVLVQPFLATDAGARPALGPFWLARIARLYGPAWGSLVLAFAVLAAVSLVNGADPGALPYGRAGKDALLVPTRVSNEVNGVLWSLSWEVAFSLVVPLLLVGLLGLERHTRSKLASAVVVAGVTGAFLIGSMFVGGAAHDALINGSAFIGGVSTAFARRACPEFRAMRTRVRTEAAVVACFSVVLTARWLILPYGPSDGALRIAEALATAGAIAVVGWVVVSEPAQRFFARPALLKLGALSFSLYLVHAPLLEAVHELSGSAAWSIPLAIALVGVVTLGFKRLVETPSHRLARRLARSGTTPTRS